jgi:hypothetical protein
MKYEDVKQIYLAQVFKSSIKSVWPFRTSMAYVSNLIYNAHLKEKDDENAPYTKRLNWTSLPILSYI